MLPNLQQVMYDLWTLPRPPPHILPLISISKGLVYPCKIHAPPL